MGRRRRACCDADDPSKGSEGGQGIQQSEPILMFKSEPLCGMHGQGDSYAVTAGVAEGAWDWKQVPPFAQRAPPPPVIDLASTISRPGSPAC